MPCMEEHIRCLHIPLHTEPVPREISTRGTAVYRLTAFRLYPFRTASSLADCIRCLRTELRVAKNRATAAARSATKTN